MAIRRRLTGNTAEKQLCTYEKDTTPVQNSKPTVGLYISRLEIELLPIADRHSAVCRLIIPRFAGHSSSFPSAKAARERKCYAKS